MLKKLPLILFILGLSYCTLWVGGYSHWEQIEDDQNVGKTLLIYPSAGQFVLNESWYFGKQSGDSYFSSERSLPDSDTPPRLYRMEGKYQVVHHGSTKIFAGPGFTLYLIKPVQGEIDRRLFSFSVDLCEEQTDLIDSSTGIKVDFVCD